MYMFVGILFSVLVSVSTGIFSTLAYFAGRGVNSRFQNAGSGAFAIFWLLMGFVWYFTAIADFFSYLEMRYFALQATYALQVFVGASLIAAAYYLNDQVLNKWRKNAVVVLYVMAYFFFLVTLFTFKLEPHADSFFSAQNISPDSTLFIFTGMFMPLWFLAVVLFFRILKHGARYEKPLRNFLLFSSISLILIGTAGSLDELGIVSGWVVTFSRLISLISAIVAYASVLALHEPKELVV